MDKQELIKIAIAAAVGTVAKELVTWLIKRSSVVTVQLVKNIPIWFKKYWPCIDFAFSAGNLVLWVLWFFSEDGSEPATRSEVRDLIIKAIMISLYFYIAGNALERWVAYNKKKEKEPNKALEPTSTVVTIPASQEVAPTVPVAHLRRWAEEA